MWYSCALSIWRCGVGEIVNRKNIVIGRAKVTREIRNVGSELYRVTVLWLPYILVTVCTDIVTVRIGMAYSNCTVATVHIGNNVH